MVSGMCRIGKRSTKKSVVKKKLKRLSDREIPVFVSRIYAKNGRMEVTMNKDDIEQQHLEEEDSTPLLPISSISEGRELIGTVVDVRPYGCIVDVNANRNGLLHIQRVADLYGTYIDKEAGLIKAGLERGAKIRVSCVKNERKRLSLDFTDDVKDEAERQRLQKEEEERNRQVKVISRPEDRSVAVVEEDTTTYDEEAAAWAAYNEEDYDDEYEDEDEDRDIEDALGIGFY